MFKGHNSVWAPAWNACRRATYKISIQYHLVLVSRSYDTWCNFVEGASIGVGNHMIGWWRFVTLKVFKCIVNLCILIYWNRMYWRNAISIPLLLSFWMTTYAVTCKNQNIDFNTKCPILGIYLNGKLIFKQNMFE